MILLCVIVILWNDVKREGKIKYSTTVTMMLFFDGACSLFSALLFLGLGKLYKVTDGTYGDSESVIKSKVSMIIIAGKSFII